MRPLCCHLFYVKKMELNTAMMFSIFLVMGFIVLASYLYCVYQMTHICPEKLDIDALWSGFYENNDKKKPRLLIWTLFIIGEIASWSGVVAHAMLYIVYEDEFSISYVVLYFFFFTSLLFWPLCAIHGKKYYHATIVGMILTAVFSGALFSLSMATFGPESFRSYVLLPLFLHCLFFDLVVWAWNWNPKDTTLFCELKSKCDPVVFSIEED